MNKKVVVRTGRHYKTGKPTGFTALDWHLCITYDIDKTQHILVIDLPYVFLVIFKTRLQNPDWYTYMFVSKKEIKKDIPYGA